MKTVQTVLGEVETGKLGCVLMHEHIVGAPAGIAENYPQFYGENAFQTIVSDLNTMKGNGILTVVDATPFDLGRNIGLLQKAAEATGVNLIACTGFFLEPSPFLGTHAADRYAQYFIEDITKGIAGTASKAGMLKTAMDREGPTPGRELIHRAVAMASNETGTPITLHSFPYGEMGRFQIRLMREEGVPMRRVIMDHCIDTTDMDYLGWLYDQGCWLGINRLPNICSKNEICSGVPTRIKTIRNMIEAGMSDRMLFSHDFQSVATTFQNMPTKEDQAYINQLNPHRFQFLQKVVFPELERMGVSATHLQEMFAGNPRRFFEDC